MSDSAWDIRREGRAWKGEEGVAALWAHSREAGTDRRKDSLGWQWAREASRLVARERRRGPRSEARRSCCVARRRRRIEPRRQWVWRPPI